VHIQSLADTSDNTPRIRVICDSEPSVQANALTIFGEVATSNAVKGADDEHLFPAVTEYMSNTCFHLVRRFVGKRGNNYILRLYSNMVNEPDNS
jgi:hypothetical protein